MHSALAMNRRKPSVCVRNARIDTVRRSAQCRVSSAGHIGDAEAAAAAAAAELSFQLPQLRTRTRTTRGTDTARQTGLL